MTRLKDCRCQPLLLLNYLLQGGYHWYEVIEKKAFGIPLQLFGFVAINRLVRHRAFGQRLPQRGSKAILDLFSGFTSSYTLGQFGSCQDAANICGFLPRPIIRGGTPSPNAAFWFIGIGFLFSTWKEIKNYKTIVMKVLMWLIWFVAATLLTLSMHILFLFQDLQQCTIEARVVIYRLLAAERCAIGFRENRK